MRFGVLGALEVHTDRGVPVRVPELKVRALLASLLAAGGEVVPTERLVDELWPGRRPADPRTALQARVSQLRRALDDAEPGARALVVSQGPGYALRPAPGAVDAGRVADLLRRASAVADEGERARLLTDALALWRGAAFADLADQVALQPEIARLEGLRLDVAEDRAEALLAAGPPPTELVGELAAHVDANPLRERARAALVRALYVAGRPHDALASVRELRARLREELGTDPGPELLALEQAVLTHDPALRTPEPGAEVPAASLPTPLTPLVGRDAELARVREALRSRRLVTLVGAGGVGKTRLALAAVHEHPESARFAELDRLSRGADADEVAVVVAEACGVRSPASGESAATGPGGEPVARLGDALAAREVLLVLDNVEHVADGAGSVTASLLAAAPTLRVLATGREPLGLAGEAVVGVSGLDTDGADPPAAALFVARAREADPDAELAPDVVAAVARRLDGIPLALELAAARVRALGAAGLLARLDDRFALLGRRGHAGPERHRTLRATLDWSWELLEPDERAALRRLAPAVGGVTLAGATAMVAPGRGAEATEVVARLVDRSWLVGTERGGERRFRMLESVAAYAAERLAESGEDRAVRDRHLAVHLALVEEADEGLRGRGQRAWLDRLDAESANLRGALDHAVATGAADTALRLAEAAVWYWFLRGRADVAVRALTAALGVTGGAGGSVDPARRASVRTWLDGLVHWLRHPDPVGFAGVSREASPRARWFLLTARWGLDEPRAAVAALTDLLATFRAAGDRWGAAAVLASRSALALGVDDPDPAERDARRADAMFDEIGDRWGGLQASFALGEAAAVRGRHDEAHRILEGALRVAEDLGLTAEVAGLHGGLGRLALVTGDLDEADRRHRRARDLARAQGLPGYVGFADFGLLLARRRRGDLDGAQEGLEAWLHGRDGAFLALPLAELGFVAEQRGDGVTALARHREGHAEALRSGSPRSVALALEGLAGAYGLLGEPERAARLLGAAGALRAGLGAPLGPGERGDVDRVRARLHASLGHEATEAAEAAGAADPLPSGDGEDAVPEVVDVVRAVSDDWREARDVRLRALADAPGAFAATWVGDAAFDEATWRERLESAWFLARRGDRTVGLAVGIDEPDVADARMLVSMWVTPERRGGPVAGRLVDAVARWARDDGARVLTAWVVDGNARARRFYVRRGFVADGARQPLPSDPAVGESRLRLELLDP